jgi:hypothetical protein
MFKPNRRGIGQLLNSPEVEAVLLARMEEAHARAIAIAPVETGRYKESFVVGLDHEKPDRPRATLTNLMWYAMSVEFGAGHVPRHRTLGKALSPELYH